MSQQQSSGWDLGRFVKTLSYFGAIPFLSSLDWFQQWFGSRPDPKVDSSAIAYGTALQASTSSADPRMLGVILVAGATGGVGRRVVQKLLERGYRVRSLVRDRQRAVELLGDRSEIVEADITRPETLTPAAMKNVSTIICCTGARVQSVESDRPAYETYQASASYSSDAVETPEYVEYRGVQNLVQAAALELSQGPLIFDFASPAAAVKDIWGALDDVVMGGVSESQIQLNGEAALFFGNVSTANSGGFASVRTRNFDPPLDLSGANGVELRVRGDGNRYKFMLRTETGWDSVAYSYSFDTEPHTWITIRIPFNRLIPVFRAKTVKDARPLNASQVRAFQLMLSKFEYDGALNPHFLPGSFQLQVQSIKTYSTGTLPQFILVSSAGVSHPGQPHLNLADESPAVGESGQLGNILTWKQRGEDSVRQSGIPYTIIRPCALTEEAGGQSLVFAQGDTLKGKVSRDDVAEVCVQALAHPQACNTVFEVAEGQGGCAPSAWECLFLKLNSTS